MAINFISLHSLNFNFLYFPFFHFITLSFSFMLRWLCQLLLSRSEACIFFSPYLYRYTSGEHPVKRRLYTAVHQAGRWNQFLLIATGATSDDDESRWARKSIFHRSEERYCFEINCSRVSAMAMFRYPVTIFKKTISILKQWKFLS